MPEFFLGKYHHKFLSFLKTKSLWNTDFRKQCNGNVFRNPWNEWDKDCSQGSSGILAGPPSEDKDRSETITISQMENSLEKQKVKSNIELLVFKIGYDTSYP